MSGRRIRRRLQRWYRYAARQGDVVATRGFERAHDRLVTWHNRRERCRPLVDDGGRVVAHVLGAEMDDEARGHMLAIVEAARRLHEATDTPERRERYEAGQARIRERNARLGLPQ